MSQIFTKRYRAMSRLVVLLLVSMVALSIAPLHAEAQAEASEKVYFDATGQVLGGPFLEAWKAQGGIREAGEPISPAVQEGERWVQWFTFLRLEIARQSLDGATADDAASGSIGTSIVQSLGFLRWHPAFQQPTAPGGEGVRVFDNGYTLANAFMLTYERNEAGDRLGMPISQEFGVRETVYQLFERGGLSWHPDFGVNVVPLGMIDAALHGNLRLSGEQPEGVPSFTEELVRPAPGANGEKWIDINLSTYTLTAFEGQTPVMQTLIVDGAPETPTVRGTFYTYWKLDAQTMQGFNTDGSEYLTEDVPWVMYFYADYAIHGAYWRSSFGYSGSHGCVNAPAADAAWLYDWAPYETRVEVHD